MKGWFVQLVPITIKVMSSNPVHSVLDTTLCDKVCQRSAAGRWFLPGTPVSFINKTDRHDIVEILLKVAFENSAKIMNIFYYAVI
jgi:hypothetical protein